MQSLFPLESSEQEFTSRYANFAAQGVLYPQQEGHPLMEFASAGRVLYLFDRSGPYTVKPGEARVVVHGLLDRAARQRLAADTAVQPEETLVTVGVSSVEGQGRVLAVWPGVWAVQARLPLVLASFEALPAVQVGDWVSFRTLPPLHGFLAS